MTMPLIATGYPARRVPRVGVAPEVRGERVVHQLDGIEPEVHPADLLAVGHQLWDLWRRHPQFTPCDLILGLDAGGILPTVALSLASATPYKLAWKLDLDLPDKRVFHERHARRTDVFVYGDLRGRRVLIVDDEITSGHTVASLLDVLVAAGATAVGVMCLVEDTAGAGRSLVEGRGVACCSLTRI